MSTFEKVQKQTKAMANIKLLQERKSVCLCERKRRGFHKMLFQLKKKESNGFKIIIKDSLF